MSDSRPIGVFDSGVGGLTVLRAIKAALPDEDTVYFGDTARVPYGTRSANTVITYAVNTARTLVQHGDIKALVVACNTVSAVAIDTLRDADALPLGMPVVGVIEPGAGAAARALQALSSSTTPRSVAVLGTPGTVRSGAYARALVALGIPHSSAVACPLFVPLAEEGWVSGEVPALVADRYIQQLPDNVGVVILGCTHYPLLKAVIQARLSHFRPGAVVVDGASATATAVALSLAENGLQAPARSSSHTPRHRLMVSDAPAQMASLSEAFLGQAVSADDVELVDVVMGPYTVRPRAV
jgi:glutamate racemase